VRLHTAAKEGHARNWTKPPPSNTDRGTTHRRRTRSSQSSSRDKPTRRTTLIFQDHQSVDRQSATAADPLRAGNLAAARANNCRHQMKEAPVRTGG